MSRRNQSPFSGSSRARRPWWLVLVIAGITWAYQHFSQQPERDQPPRDRRAQPAPTKRRPPAKTKTKGHSPSAEQPGHEGGKTFTDEVVRVKDGDTVVFKRQGDARLIGVDCPEKSQDGGPEATAFTERALTGKTVEVELCAKQPTDRYGRSLAFIYVSDSQGRRVLFNSELVRQGYARVYSLRPCTVDEEAWGALYEEARASRRGLFGLLGDMPDPVAYRRRPRGGTSSTN